MEQSYEVVSRSPGPRRLLIAAPLLIAAGVLAAGVFGGGLTARGTTSVASEAWAASAAPAGDAVTADAPAPSVDAVPGPPRSMDCGQMPAFECPAAILAAREALGRADITIASAHAWPTLLCGDDLDCPRPLLARADPVGSVTFSLADGAEVWVNIVRVPAPTRLNETGERLIAQVIRWFRAGR